MANNFLVKTSAGGNWLDMAAITAATDEKFSDYIASDLEFLLERNRESRRPEPEDMEFFRSEPYGKGGGIKIEFVLFGIYRTYATYVYNGRRYNYKDAMPLNCMESFVTFVRRSRRKSKSKSPSGR